MSKGKQAMEVKKKSYYSSSKCLIKVVKGLRTKCSENEE